MITKTQRNYRRRMRTWPGDTYPAHKHEEVVLRETWWLLWFIPLYTREKIEKTNL